MLYHNVLVTYRTVPTMKLDEITAERIVPPWKISVIWMHSSTCHHRRCSIAPSSPPSSVVCSSWLQQLQDAVNEWVTPSPHLRSYLQLDNCHQIRHYEFLLKYFNSTLHHKQRQYNNVKTISDFIKSSETRDKTVFIC